MSAVSSPSGVWGEAAADKRFGAYWESINAALVAAVFVDYRKNKCNFLHNPIPHRAAPYEKFSPEAVATIAVWKSAPILRVVCVTAGLAESNSGLPPGL